MTKYETVMRKAIANRFSGLREKDLETLTKYYFDNYGGEGGCEECYDGWYLCCECEQALMSEAYRLARGELA